MAGAAQKKPPRKPKVLGLTGSIAMGKSHAANGFRGLGVPVFDADEAVHTLMGPGGAAHAGVAALFPDAVTNATIDRRKLGAIVFADAAALARLERFLHPLVHIYEDVFLRGAAAAGHDFVVLEIPLLFETDGGARCDAVAVVTAPGPVQEARALKRPGMTAEKLAGVRARQMPDVEKCRAADFVIDTSRPKEETLRAIENIATVMKDFARSGADDFKTWKESHA